MVIQPLKRGNAVAMFDGGIMLRDGKLTFRFIGTSSVRAPSSARRRCLLRTIGGGLGVPDVEMLARVRKRHPRRHPSGRPMDGRCQGTSAWETPL
jgi:hypothetical protein